MSAGRKDIQRARMWRYFLDAATEVIEEEGTKNVTIRKIAERAGFTSSTAYNYFKDLSHLKFFAAMRFTTDYLNELPSFMDKGTNQIEKWLYSWECFCKHSFEQPEIYSLIFMDNLGTQPQTLLDDYYKIFKEELIGLPEQIKPIIMEHSFAKRSALYIQSAVSEGFIKEENIDLIAEMTLMIWKGMMNTFMNQRREYTKEEAIRRTLYFIEECVMNVIEQDKRGEITFSPQI
ncbi:TetR/AcrR family transcriptional regulator [Alkalihalobacillus sp. MEB130]|uniref:TetR/AcrR family transcriptional regulator n=1 Tax=Alkalihalobacillus sp. MEB130 TaxID=2976704 RepID=UPI0028DF8A27|nr:TetR/AcrR family transcriptional regulator [Alkalihalobacillus sp. MEB130]MDT8862912.1 TetR/AcrR family transcriptional regulator [Alkalihalobacillus sp. MEB130]